ncbi:L7Ae/L30e/S12e/Gadd45 family ribosomal protein [Veillonella montpellierensis]|uniref:L7Ae/L30e/S12e/Gadd45 family ribosomal protein n=1 Tax=Veillonella montpellierensis TaxID=187328 RepID=UPI0023F6A7A6|nr:ribosomal L7Ae/L30e/S12e/Gadd45 family protein [Veillonella montpellierensis]
MEIDTLRSLHKTIGAKQTSKAIKRGEVKLVLVAVDGDEPITAPILELCKEYNVPVEEKHTMEELGKACHIKVKASAVGILD